MPLILRRRTFVINPTLQFSILLTSLGHIFLLVAVVSTALFLPLILQLTSSDADAAKTSDAAVRILYLHDVYWLPVLLSLVAIGLHSVWASHRIAGPIFRFRRVCESMAAGVVPVSVTLRKGDHLQAEMDVVNAMLDTWRDLIAKAQQDAARLQGALSAHRASGSTGAEDGDAGWAEITRTHQQLLDTLGRARCESRPPTPAGASADTTPRRS